MSRASARLGSPVGSSARSISETPAKDEQASAPTPTQICDPYGNGGKPLSTEQVQKSLKFHEISPAWQYSTEDKRLARTFSFKAFALRREDGVNIPGFISGSAAAAAFRFMQTVGNLCANNGHWVYQMDVVPRRAELSVQLKTVPRGGITRADVHLASMMDISYENFAAQVAAKKAADAAAVTASTVGSQVVPATAAKAEENEGGAGGAPVL